VAVTLKLKPFSGTLEQTKNVAFELTGVSRERDVRVRFENATLGHNAVLVDSQAESLELPAGGDEGPLSGNIDLRVEAHVDSNVISVFANVEEKFGDDWRLTDIAAFAFQIQSQTKKTTTDRVSVYPPFIGPREKTQIQVESKPYSILDVFVNGRKFEIKTNYDGIGTRNISGLDVISGSASTSSAMQRFAVEFARRDNPDELYDSGSFIHYVPEGMKVLQSAGGNPPTDAPECAILDLEPGPGLRLRSLDDFCFEGAVVGSESIFDRDSDESDYYNSRAGFCGPLNEASPAGLQQDGVCRIYNQIASTDLPDGTGLLAFTSQYDPSAEPGITQTDINKDLTLASRVILAQVPTSLKNEGNPVRNGTILKPANFYHTAILNSVNAGDLIGIEFRVTGGGVWEVQVTAESDASATALAFVAAINANDNNLDNEITALARDGEVDVYSESRFSIRIVVREGTSDVEVCLDSNRTVEVFTSTDGADDEGDTIVFLTPKLGARSYSVLSRTDRLIRFVIPEGVNNTFGPTITSNFYCEKFVITDSVTAASTEDLVTVVPLPYIKDIFQRELPAVNPTVCSYRDDVGDTFIYVICQSPISDGAYQLFYYSFRIGDDPSTGSPDWKQLTYDGENKNPTARIDGGGNIHVVWESDRTGPTQVYYGVLGPASPIISNQVLMSGVEKAYEAGVETPLINVSPIETDLDGDWHRLLDNGGGVSIAGNSIGIVANPVDDGALALRCITADENGESFDGQFSQFSYQISFNLKASGFQNIPLGDRNLQLLFDEWKNQFTPVGNNRYEYEGNRMTLDQFERYYEKIIPIVGSYRFPNVTNGEIAGGTDAVGFDHTEADNYIPFSDAAELAHIANVNHFVLALMPEKVRFKAVNQEPKFVFCERNELSVDQCDGYVSELEEIHYTGRFKLALLLATSEDESTGHVSRKRFHVIRQFGDPIQFQSESGGELDHDIDILVHYNKASSDHIGNILKVDRYGQPQDYRFYGDIVVAIDDEARLGQSFVADFSNQFREMNIGFGIPSQGQYLTNEFLPYNGNLYDDLEITLDYSAVKIGVPTMSVNSNYSSFTYNDRSTNSLTVQGNALTNLISNGSFEETLIPIVPIEAILDEQFIIQNWRADQGIYYHYESTSFLLAANGVRFIEMTGLDNSTLGFIEQDVPTVSGKEYIIRFRTASHPLAAVHFGANTIRKTQLSAGPASTEFPTFARFDNGSIYYERYMKFTANSSITTVRFENTSSANADGSDLWHLDGMLIDDVRMYATEDILDELASDSSWDNLRISEEEFKFNKSLTNEGFTQVPITFSDTQQNRNPDLWVDHFHKPHVAFQSNRNGYWDIYYSGARDRSVPFRFDTRITDSRSVSVNPSIAVDPEGRRLIAWQDDRNGDQQIYCATSDERDEQWHNQCRVDEADEYVYRINSNSDPYDPYFGETDTLSCQVVFDFEAPENADYHFRILFYSNEARTNLVKAISSKSDIAGWFVNDLQMPYDGSPLLEGETATVVYNVSQEDALTGQVYYLTIEFESVDFENYDATVIDVFGSSSNITILDGDPGTDLSLGSNESDTNLIAVVESQGLSPIAIDAQDNNYFTTEFGDGMSFPRGLDRLPGLNQGDQYVSVFFKVDPATTTVGINFSIKFKRPIVAIFYDGELLTDTSQDAFGNPTFSYPDGGWELGEPPLTNDNATISADRMTLSGFAGVNEFQVDSFRVILGTAGVVDGTSNFAFYCPSEQPPRCDVNVRYQNDSPVEQDVHFKASFYADPERELLLFSTLTFTDPTGWTANSTSFPSSGLTIPAGEYASAIFTPNFLPSEVWAGQTALPYGFAIRSNFDKNNDGWRIADDTGVSGFNSTPTILGPATWDSDRGRGALRQFNASADLRQFIAPAKFLGNKINFYGGSFKWKARLDESITQTGSPTTPIFFIRGTEGLLYFFGSPSARIPDRSEDYTEFEVVISETSAGSLVLYDDGGGFGAATADDVKSVLRNIVSIEVEAKHIVSQDDQMFLSEFSMEKTSAVSERTFRRLLCGVPYYVVIDSYIDGALNEMLTETVLCPCFWSEADIWRENKDAMNWSCSGQGGSDMRVTNTSNDAIRPHVAAAENNLIYISWEDYRYTRVLSAQPALSPDYFFGIWDAASNALYSSGQGDFDRRMTYFSDEGNLVLYDADIFIDPFQNINIGFHDGTKAYSRACSVGCPLEAFNEAIRPCQFTDGTDDDFYQVGGSPERDVDQYMQVRIKDEYVAYSTYLDLQQPMPVINDCFVELDIVGVPGTYAYRLKNDEDEDFTEWLPIGADLPAQETDGTGAQAERDFFKARFTGRDRFIAPWVLSPNNGVKRICCEVLTFFGKTERFCVNVQALYKELEYDVDFFFDAELTKPVPKFGDLPVVSTKFTETAITEDNLTSITEEVTETNEIYVKISFRDVSRLELLERLGSLERFSSLGGITMSVYQQGLADQLNLSLTLMDSETFGAGVYGGAFRVEEDDTVVNKDGLAVIVVNVPGNCNPFTFEEAIARLGVDPDVQSLEQRVSILNDFTVFRDRYTQDDARGSFGNPAYYKTQRFGSGGANPRGASSDWSGGGDGPINGATGGGTTVPAPPPPDEGGFTLPDGGG
tara:strand:+ start:320295 stop:328112 length:7818 start_codon:yes stop_codon:yes gene_type:complete